MALQSTRNSAAVEKRVLIAARRQLIGYRPRSLSAFYEHGQWWIEDRRTGAQWSVHDADPGEFGFEQVTQGDED